MKSKLIALALATSFVLSACSGNTETKEEVKTEEPTQVAQEAETEKPTEESKSEEAKDVKTEEVAEKTADDTTDPKNLYNSVNIGKELTIDKFGTVKIYKAGTVDNATFELGDVTLKIKGAAILNLTTDDPFMTGYWEENSRDMLCINYEVTNNTDETRILYTNEAKITTDTKEQLEPDYGLSKFDSEMLGNVTIDGENFYYPASPQDINEFALHIGELINEEYSTIADGIKITFTFDKDGKLSSIK